VDYKLEPCPFCGNPAILNQEKRAAGPYFTIGCETEDCRACHWKQGEAFPASLIPAEVSAWNLRPTCVFDCGDRLRQWRRKRELSLVWIADTFGCSVVEASNLERGQPVPRRLVIAAERLLNTQGN